MERHARYRAPVESGQTLVSPSWGELSGLLAQGAAWRRGADFHVQGVPLVDFAASTRREVVAAAASYVDSYRSNGTGPLRPLSAVDRPIIVTGHQPELVHPGVWLKNFAAASLAETHHGLSLNLVIDGDACRGTAIRVPTGTLQEPQQTLVEFDAAGGEVPWEERGIVDAACWQSFSERVREATAPLLSERLLDEWWQTPVERAAATGRIGASLAQARHLLELGWGRESLELPQSRMCQTAGFRRFACHLLANLPRLVEAHNSALADYRRVYRLRNHAQPVPNLAVREPWLEAPLWLWSTADPRRRPVFVRQDGTGLMITDRHGFERPLPLAADDDGETAIMELARWEAEGIKLRSRALVTTMFARVALADLFIHGIGGAKYDQVTDAICQRFFGSAPPEFAAMSGTLHLPLECRVVDAGEIRGLRHQLRDMEFHPERHLEANGVAADLASQAAALTSRKQRWIAATKNELNAKRRHEGISAANRGLTALIAAKRSASELRLAQAVERSRAGRILTSREYAFCLFPPEQLQKFLLAFPR